MYRTLHVATALGLLAACADSATEPDPDPLPQASHALVSAPVMTSSGAAAVRVEGGTAWISMPPGTDPGASGVTIRNGDAAPVVTASMIDGGFDPVGVAAEAGDSLVIVTHGSAGSVESYARVPVRSRPVVVRTMPRHRRTDVPLNSIVTVVFNEPMDPATFTEAVHLRLAGRDVAGTVAAVLWANEVLAATFTPAEPLDASTEYQLVVSTAARSRNGTPLAVPLDVEFTTGTEAVGGGDVEVTVATSGTVSDPDGYTVSVDGGAPRPIGVNASTAFANLSAGLHTVELAGLNDGCVVAGGASRPVTVQPDLTVSVAFDVVCSPVVGTLVVTATTQGPAPDLDGYRVSIDGAPTRPLGVNGTLTVENLPAGTHSVAVSGMSVNCTVAGGPERLARVGSAGPTAVEFVFTCLAVGSGNVVVNTSTVGSDIDGDGYLVSLNRDPPQPIAVNGTVTYVDLPDTTDHLVTLSGLSLNCGVAGGDTVWTVAAATAITFNVSCTPDIRPEGTLAFVGPSGNGKSAIFVSNPDGSGRVQLTDGTRSVGRPTWSPDGRRLAFAMENGATLDIYVMDADGSNLVRRTDIGWNSSPAWSPDGRTIAFTSLRDGTGSQLLYAMNVDGDWHAVTLLGQSAGYHDYPAWSPDGSEVAFVSDWAFFDGPLDLYVARADGSGIREVPSHTTGFGQPAWSPDGRTFALTAGELGLAVMNVDGSGLTGLLPFAHSPAWSPDGAVIAVTAACGGDTLCIRYLSAAGHRSTVVIPNASYPAWKP